MKGCPGPLEEEPCYFAKKFTLLIFLPAFPKGTYSLLPGRRGTGEEEII